MCTILEVVGQHGYAGQGREQGCDALLAVDHEQAWTGLLRIRADLTGFLLGSGFPQVQAADREASVQRVEEVAHLTGIPDERALQVWQRDLALTDSPDKVVDRVRGVLEQRHAVVPQALRRTTPDSNDPMTYSDRCPLIRHVELNPDARFSLKLRTSAVEEEVGEASVSGWVGAHVRRAWLP
jgi:hypothetical protein